MDIHSTLLQSHLDGRIPMDEWEVSKSAEDKGELIDVAIVTDPPYPRNEDEVRSFTIKEFYIDNQSDILYIKRG